MPPGNYFGWYDCLLYAEQIDLDELDNARRPRPIAWGEMCCDCDIPDNGPRKIGEVVVPFAATPQPA